MTLVIKDLNNPSSPVIEWEGATLVVMFKVHKGKSYDKKKPNERGPGRYAYFGFDWLKLDKNGEIRQVHDVGIKLCTHVYGGGDKYVSSRYELIEEILKEYFALYTSANGDTKRHSARSWLHLPGVKEHVDNLSIVLDGTYQGVGLTFEIPSGIIMEYEEGSSFVKIENNSPVVFTAKEHRVRITATEAVEKVEINVKNPSKEVIGSLGVYARAQRSLNIYLWAAVENPKERKTKTQIEEAAKKVLYNNDERKKLKEQLDRVFHQAGVDMILCEGGVISYDPESDGYKALVSAGNIESEEKGRDFFKQLKKMFPILKEQPGINLILADARCEYKIPSSDATPLSGSLSGLGDIGNKYCIIFNQSRNDYGTCAHEIGHTLGLIHSFYDAGADEAIKGKNDNIKDDMLRLIDNKNPDDVAYINMRLARERIFEKILFEKERTSNLMDYNSGNHDYLFKWQWDVIHKTLDVYNF